MCFKFEPEKCGKDDVFCLEYLFALYIFSVNTRNKSLLGFLKFRTQNCHGEVAFSNSSKGGTFVL